MNVLLERFPYRYCEEPDRGYIQRYDENTRRYRTFYECDSQLQLLTAMEDFDYTKWLDPEGVPCYREQRGDVVKNPRGRG